jgi:SAM-dependent methyltransferase
VKTPFQAEQQRSRATEIGVPANRAAADVRADFDAIARLSPPSTRPDRLTRWLLCHLPERCGDILEIGCGTGEATRFAAARADRVVALDFSPEMVRIARERSAAHPNIGYHAADALTWQYPQERFDAVISIATLHHLPFEPMIAAMKRTLRPGGVLLILDLLDRSHRRYLPLNVLALLPTLLHRQSAALRRAYRQHGAHDVYLRPREARDVFARHLPGVRVRHHLRWRYSVVWRKPAG